MSGQAPGQAAYEASLTVIGEDLDGEPWAWGSLTPKLRQSWQAAAQAAIDVFLAGDSVSAESIREALAAQEQPAPKAQRLTRHADHDPSMICRPAGHGLCEVWTITAAREQPADAQTPREALQDRLRAFARTDAELADSMRLADAYAQERTAAGLRADLEAAVRIWRRQAHPDEDDGGGYDAARHTVRVCADELAQILARHPKTTPESPGGPSARAD